MRINLGFIVINTNFTHGSMIDRWPAVLYFRKGTISKIVGIDSDEPGAPWFERKVIKRITGIYFRCWIPLVWRGMCLSPCSFEEVEQWVSPWVDIVWDWDGGLRTQFFWVGPAHGMEDDHVKT